MRILQHARTRVYDVYPVAVERSIKANVPTNNLRRQLLTRGGTKSSPKSATSSLPSATVTLSRARYINVKPAWRFGRRRKRENGVELIVKAIGQAIAQRGLQKTQSVRYLGKHRKLAAIDSRHRHDVERREVAVRETAIGQSSDARTFNAVDAWLASERKQSV